MRSWITPLICLVSWSSVAVAAPPRLSVQVPPQFAARWAWTEQPFEGDDTPYRVARKKIDAELRLGKQPYEVLTRYRSLAQKSLNDPVAKFRWGYAAYRANVTKPPLRQSDILQGVPDALGASPSPSTYEYLRLRYLVTSQYATNDYLVALGERLVQRDKDDWEVAHYQYQGNTVATPAGKQRKLYYAQELWRIKGKPNNVLLAVAYVYELSWAINEDSEDARKAIEYWETYLAREKSDQKYRQQTQEAIRKMKIQLARRGIQYKPVKRSVTGG